MDLLDSIKNAHSRKLIILTYRTMLGRDPDPDGLESYCKRLRDGESFEHILSQVRASDEFIKRHAASSRPVSARLANGVSRKEPNSMASTEMDSRANRIYSEIKSELLKKQGDS